MSAPVNARTAMIEVAEQMFAERGIDGVSMRDVAATAGQRNNSAVRYHFGGRDGLVLAVFQHRMSAINRARREYLYSIDRDGNGTEVRALVQACIIPLADFLRTAPETSHYARFIAQVAPSVDFTRPELRAVNDANNEVAARLTAALSHLDRRVAVERVDLMLNMAAAGLAIYEQRRTHDHPGVAATFEETVAHLIDMSVGALLAPVSHPQPSENSPCPS